MFGKLTHGILINAPSTLTVDGMVHYHPSDELYESMGYFPIVDTECPETNEESPKYYASSYEEKDGEIVRVWAETEAPEAAESNLTIDDKITELNFRIANNEQTTTNIELALCEVFEMIEGGSTNV